MTCFRCGLLWFMAWVVITASFAVEPVKLRPGASLYVDGAGAGLESPEGVGCDTRFGVVVADSGNGRLVRYRMGDETLTAVAEIASAQIPYPTRVEFGSKGEILVLDGKSHRIARIADSGEFQAYIEPAGMTGAVVARSFALDEKGNLHLLDVRSGRVLVLDASGQTQREIAFPESYGFFSDLAVDGGTVFVLDSVERRVYSADHESTLLTPLSDSLREDLDFPTAIAADGKGRLYVIDQNGGGVVILGRDGSFRGRQSKLGWREGFLRYPSDLCIDDEGNVFVADRGNNRVQTFMIVQ